MALTRKMLKGMGLTDEQIDSIIEGHTDTVTALKDERDGLKEQVDALKAGKEMPGAGGGKPDGKGDDGESGDEKYAALKAEYEKYKADVAAKERDQKVRAAYRKLLEDANVDPRRIATIMRCTDTKDLKLTDDDKLENAEALTSAIKTEWADFIQTDGKKGVDVKNPGNGQGGGQRMTRDEIMKIEDAGERQKAIAENHDLFGF